MKALGIKFFLDPKTLDKKETYKLYCRVVYDREKTEFALPYRLRPDQWNEAKERTYENEGLNEELIWIESKLMELKRQLTYEGKKFSVFDLVAMFRNRKTSGIRLADYMEKVLGGIAQSDRHAEGTKRHYRSKAKLIVAFLADEKKADMAITDLDLEFIQRLDHWLLTRRSEQYRKPYKRSHINKFHKLLCMMLNKARRERLIVANPYDAFPLPKDNTPLKIKYLTEEELELIVKHRLGGNESLQRVRDFFVFCCFTGLRFTDAMHLEKHHIRKEKHKGRERFVLEISQQKTGNVVVIPLYGLAETLYLKQLESDMCRLTGRLFVPLSNVKVNAYLKTIADLCGIDKKLHHHMARHTAATHLLSKGVPEAHVAAILGHTSTAMTRKYAKVLKTSLLDIADQMERFEKEPPKHF